MNLKTPIQLSKPTEFKCDPITELLLFAYYIGGHSDNKPVEDLHSRDKAETKAETNQTSHVGDEPKDGQFGGSLVSW